MNGSGPANTGPANTGPGPGGRGHERGGRAVPPAARGDDRAARAAAGDPAGHARQPHREHRAAADRGRPRRGRAPVLGGDRLHPRVHGHHAVLRQARRHVRAEEVLRHRDRHLPHRLGAVRPVAVHGGAHRVPRAAGPGGRRADGQRDGDARRHRGPARAREVHELHDGGDDARHHRRPAARRVHHHRLLLALDLLHQPAGGRRGAGLPAGHPARSGQEDQPQGRLPGRVAARRGRDLADPAGHLGRDAVPHGARRRSSASPCSPWRPWWRSTSPRRGRPSRCCRCTSSATGTSPSRW